MLILGHGGRYKKTSAARRDVSRMECMNSFTSNKAGYKDQEYEKERAPRSLRNFDPTRPAHAFVLQYPLDSWKLTVNFYVSSDRL